MEIEWKKTTLNFKHSLEILCEELVYKQGTMIRIVTVWCFIGDGEKLADVGLDDDHCICIWNWKKEEKLATTRYVWHLSVVYTFWHLNVVYS